MRLPYKLVELVDDRFIITEFPAERFLAAMTERGHVFTGENLNPRQRAELQGAPKFRDLYGPMWDGNRIRYENRAAYQVLSD